jgi:hypothetical protein
MGQLLTSEKWEFLSEAPIGVLHEESIEWLSEISFFRKEIAFFFTLLEKIIDINSQHKTLLSIENQLIDLSSKKLDELNMEVQRHEEFLVVIMETRRHDETVYRSKHYTLSKKFQDFEKEMKTFKRNFFQVVEKNCT